MTDRLDPTFVRQQIEALRVAYPEVWDDEQLLQDMLESETGLHEFLTVAVAKMRVAEGFVAGQDKLIEDLVDRRLGYERRVEALRRLMFKIMQAAGMKRAELLQATLSIHAGQRKVIITDEAQLLDKYVRIKREPDRIAIKEAMARGIMVLGAEISNAEPVLVVRVK